MKSLELISLHVQRGKGIEQGYGGQIFSSGYSQLEMKFLELKRVSDPQEFLLLWAFSVLGTMINTLHTVIY